MKKSGFMLAACTAMIMMMIMMMSLDAEGRKAKKVKYDFKYDYVSWFHEGMATVGISASTSAARAADKVAGAITLSSGSTLLFAKYGAIDSSGRERIPLKYQWVGRFYGGIAPVALNGKWGYADTDGNELTPIKYDYVSPAFIDGFAPVGIGGKFGLVNARGEETLPVRYDDVTVFSECMAAVRVGDKWGYADTSGREVIPAKYEIPMLNYFVKKLIAHAAGNSAVNLEEMKNIMFSAFSGGVAAVCLNGKWGYIDREDKMVVPLKYDKVRKFKEGMAAVRIDGRWGFADMTGREAVAAKYTSVEDFSEGMAAVRADRKWGFVDREGNEIVPLQYSEVKPFREGMAAVRLKDSWGFVNAAGAEAIPPAYGGALSFSEGKAAVETGGKWGYIDRTGKEAIAPKYRQACDFSEGMAAVCLNKRWGFIDGSGAEVIPAIYRKSYAENVMFIKPNTVYAGRFACGLAPVWIDSEKKFGFVNKTGEMAIPPRYQAVSNFSNGYAAGAVFRKNIQEVVLELIDTAGRIVYPAVRTDDKNVINTLGWSPQMGLKFLDRMFMYLYVINPAVRTVDEGCSTAGDDVFVRMSGDGGVKSVKFGFFGHYERPDRCKYRPFKSRGKWGFIDGEGNPMTH
ncbi:MAG: WG repeat-containing protein [Prevotellaceae bacterium]|jgi:hypothetical protein|nr:WG repeat-containing protein [Prevotellaceae bacterium]